MKNPQFLTNQADILSILPIHQLVILTKFGNDCIKIGDFSLMTKFLASSIFFSSVSTTKKVQKKYGLFDEETTTKPGKNCFKLLKHSLLLHIFSYGLTQIILHHGAK